MVKDLYASLIRKSYHVLTDQYTSARIIRFALTFLAFWQAFILHNHNTWIPDLVNTTSIPLNTYTTYFVVLSVVSLIALFDQYLWLSAIVLFVNVLQYLYLAIAAGLSDTPKASLGFSVFVMLISVSSFMRVILMITRNRAT